MQSSLMLGVPAAGLFFALGLPAANQAAAVKAPAPATQPAEPKELAGRYALSFDKLKPGEVPAGWKADATNPKGELAEWKVVTDAKAPSRPNVFSINKITDTTAGHFNLFWTDNIRLKDGTLEVKVRGDAGQQDQGDGLIWRAADARNYYVARYNPLESNLRLYFVKDGKRTQLAGAGNLDIKAGQWFTVKVVFNGENIQVWLNGKKLLEASDKTFANAGGVGLWTKADAASSFDDVVAEPAKATTRPQGK